MLTCAAFEIAVGHSEDIRMRRLRVLVECRFAWTKPFTNIHLPLSGDHTLISENDNPMPADTTDFA